MKETRDHYLKASFIFYTEDKNTATGCLWRKEISSINRVTIWTGAT